MAHMGFELMHKDVHVADADISEVDGDMFRLREVHSLDHMPMGTLREGRGDVLNLGRWWARRSIPESRSGLRRLLERAGLPDARSLLLGSHGLSLSDQYWVRPSGSGIPWEEVNFFDNEFSESVGMTLLGKEVAEGFVDLMSPDNTSEGNLVKMWRIVDGVRFLYKGGSVPFRQEPYNEVVATMVMDRLGIDNAGYSLGWIDGDPYSVCPDFVDRDTELITMAYVMYASRWCGTAYRTCVNACSEVGIDVVPFLDRMIVTDFLLANEDRHLYNLGLIRDAGTLEFIGPAPIYDCGSSLGYNRDVPDMAVAAGATCKPFAESFEKELDLVTDFGWVDADGLDGALQEARAFLLECEGLDSERADAMSGTIEARIEALRSRL